MGVGPTEAIFSRFFSEFPDKPVVPELKSTEELQKEAVNSNLANFGSIKQLTESANKLSIDELIKHMERISPGSMELFKQGTGLVQSWMKGEIPQDVQNQIQRQTATQAMAGGFAGSGMARNLTTRDLGLTSLQISQQGLNSAMNWLGRISSLAPTFNFASMFVTPAMAMERESAQWNRDWLANQVKASLSAEQVSANQMWGSFGYGIDMIGGSMLSKYTGNPNTTNNIGGSTNADYWTQNRYDDMMNSQGASYLMQNGGAGTGGGGGMGGFDFNGIGGGMGGFA